MLLQLYTAAVHAAAPGVYADTAGVNVLAAIASSAMLAAAAALDATHPPIDAAMLLLSLSIQWRQPLLILQHVMLQ